MPPPETYKSEIGSHPKSGVPYARVAEIGHLSVVVITTTPGRHLICQHRPPPDDRHMSAP